MLGHVAFDGALLAHAVGARCGLDLLEAADPPVRNSSATVCLVCSCERATRGVTSPTPEGRSSSRTFWSWRSPDLDRAPG